MFSISSALHRLDIKFVDFTVFKTGKFPENQLSIFCLTIYAKIHKKSSANIIKFINESMYPVHISVFSQESKHLVYLNQLTVSSLVTNL